MSTFDLDKLILALAEEFKRRDMRVHLDLLRGYYRGFRARKLAAMAEKKPPWTEELVVSWLCNLQIPPFEYVLPALARGVRACACDAGRRTAAGGVRVPGRQRARVLAVRGAVAGEAEQWELERGMAQGPGKYDKECTLVRDSASAKVALVIVIGGDRGDGFAMQAGTDVPPSVVAEMLRNVAAQIDASSKSN